MSKKISRALLSVSDKTGIVELAKALHANGVSLLSTGGTAKTLIDAGIKVTEVSEVTGFPEIMDGRVKTLHPKIHGAILARRDIDADVMSEHDIVGIDLVVVNLYPFRETIAKPDCTLTDAIENIDIGGPAMIRAAAKNYKDVAVVTDPADYAGITESLAGAGISDQMRFELSAKAFTHTAKYDEAVSAYLVRQQPGQQQPDSIFNQSLQLQLDKIQDLRYGENPHQKAAFYRHGAAGAKGIANGKQLQGKELSFNNIADSDAALECVTQFSEPACVIVKHANPCGVAIAGDLLQAYEKAYKTDPVSAFGGIIAFNRELDANTATQIVERQFVEVLLVPGVQPDALAVLASKPNIRVLQVDTSPSDNQLRPVYQSVNGGMLVQQCDAEVVTAGDLKIATSLAPTDDQIRDLLFAWQVVQFVKSNAIVFCKDGATIGVGAGQMSRVYSAKIAAIKANDVELEIASSVMASDAFFPFRDTVDQAAEYGAKAIIQPGGSMRDDESIEAANEHGIAMVFTGIRHFRH